MDSSKELNDLYKDRICIKKDLSEKILIDITKSIINFNKAGTLWMKVFPILYENKDGVWEFLYLFFCNCFILFPDYMKFLYESGLE